MRALLRARLRFPRAAALLRGGLALSSALLLPAASFARERRVERMIVPQMGSRPLEVMAEEALVRFDDTQEAAACTAALRSVGMEVLHKVGGTPWHLVLLPSGMPVSTGLSILRGLPCVVAANANRAYRPLKLPNDSNVSSQWHLSNINAYSAWEYETGSSNDVAIAVLDTGIDGTHPDLSGKLVNQGAGKSQDCSTGVCVAEHPPTPECNHGTRVAGMAAASSNNGIGVAGVSWGARLVSLKVFDGCTADCGDSPNCTASDASIIAAIDYATNGLRTALGHRRIIVNMSLGVGWACDNNDQPHNHQAMQPTINAAHAQELVLVAATGNDGASTVDEPANCTHVIPVGATDQSNDVASFSNRGGELAQNGLVAPGKAVFSTNVGGGYIGGINGTSFASPIVAGMAALVLAAKPNFTADQVRDTLRQSASNIGVSALPSEEGIHPLGNKAGAGLANAYSAMRLAITGTTEFDGTRKAIAFPNPFRPSTNGTVSITIPTSLQDATPLIKIYTLSGQLVKTLAGGGLIWDGKNEDGNPVATGTYVFYVSTDKGNTSGRLAVIR